MTRAARYAQKPLLEPEQSEVEAAVAFGRTDQWITTRYRVTPAEIAAVRAYLEAVNAEPDGENHGTRHGNRRLDSVEHGGAGAYRRHQRDREPLCDACREWQRQRSAARRAQARAGKDVA